MLCTQNIGGDGEWKGKIAYMLSHAKVSKFNFAIGANKYVCSFNISAKKKYYLVIIQFCTAYGKIKQFYSCILPVDSVLPM
jgi:hypothetical protein